MGASLGTLREVLYGVTPLQHLSHKFMIKIYSMKFNKS